MSPVGSRLQPRRAGAAWVFGSLCLVAAVAVLAAPSAPAPTVVAVGDLACQSLPQGQGTATCQSGAVADLIRELAPDRFLALGDLQYSNGTLEEFLRVWDQQFGDLLEITAPTPGNHEYGTDGAQGYFDYFGEIAHPPDGYYSFELGSWHVVALNSQICGSDPGCGPGTPQYEWLVQDLRDARSAKCTLAFMHHPRYDWRQWQKWVDDEGETPNGGTETAPLIPLWELLDGGGADVVLSAHNHVYQRWAPQDAHGNAVGDGIVQFTVGTGGRQLYPFGKHPMPENLLVAQNRAFGVIQLTLYADSYDYAWFSAPGQPDFEDAATGVPCH
jgi:hypothetical protein